MARTWLINSRGLARKVKNATASSAYQIKDCGANRECPNCNYRIDNSDVSHEWPGFPAGVKFDPSDVELLEHLEAKYGVGNSKPHMFIDEFIPTLEGDEGICCAHPEDLPGAKTDGSSVHFFHRTTNAYATGQRKRRKIQSQQSSPKENVRWHKTGNTTQIMDNGIQKGYKKIMVLYKISKKRSKANKTNWKMHQYHLGTDKYEQEGQYVVSKIFYEQQKQTEENDNALVEESDMGIIRTSPRTPKTNTPNPLWPGNSVSHDVTDDCVPSSSTQQKQTDKNDNSFVEEYDVGMICTSPRTPKTNTPNPPRPGNSVLHDDVTDDCVPPSSTQEAKFIPETSHPSSSTAQFKDDMEYPTWLTGESQAVDVNSIGDFLLCNEIFNSWASPDDSGLNHGPFPGFTHETNDVTGADRNTASGIADLENLELDTPDFALAVSFTSRFSSTVHLLQKLTITHLRMQDLQFVSQDSILDWLDWL
ncbi:hypothetical protein F0562_004892 [Nyssa sinensis]|uniref:NAC domain-containing protein n=1 Tax=Nyssa sinensis TaxID=561372 RepID=A0A5J5AGP7_9ASTE|nr:hypothetical protein F0562_004892 [Nyssa sinensis]